MGGAAGVPLSYRLLNRQVVAAAQRFGPGNLSELLASGTTWEA